MTFALLYIALSFNEAIEIGRNSSPPVQPGGIFGLISGFFLLFFLFLLALGAFGIHRFFWFIAGKEIIEASPQLLRISRKIFVGKYAKEYSAGEVKDLRVIAQQVWLLPLKRLQSLLQSNGMIAFDYGAKTYRFGLEIDEAEAKQIVLALKEGLPPQDAG